jgi:hypothetical protein
MLNIFSISFDDKPDEINPEEWLAIYKKMAASVYDEKIESEKRKDLFGKSLLEEVEKENA